LSEQIRIRFWNQALQGEIGAAKGAVFPFDFGSIPGTTADDGDPLDVLLLMDEPAFSGCLVQGRLFGVIEAKQTSDGKTERNVQIRLLPISFSGCRPIALPHLC
jgi:inorganic pyrophosphatase